MAFDYAGHSWLADWIAGVGQAVGALGTLAAVWYAVTVEKRADARRQDEAAAEEHARVRLVSVQVLEAPLGKQFREVLVRNDSAYAIFNVRLFGVNLAGQDQRLPTRVIGPRDPETFHLIESRGHAKWTVDHHGASGARVDFPQRSLEGDIGFEDYLGKAWSRTGQGEIWKVVQSAEDLRTFVPTEEYRRRNRWWSPWREKKAMSWAQVHRWRLQVRMQLVQDWCGAWWDRLRGREVRERRDGW